MDVCLSLFGFIQIYISITEMSNFK